MDDHRSRLGLDEEHSFLEKLGLFVSTLLLGPLIGLLIFAALMVLHLPPGRPWRLIVEFIVEALAFFWLCVLVFIWWRPPWFRRIYVALESKVVLIVRLTMLICVAAIAYAFLIGW